MTSLRYKQTGENRSDLIGNSSEKSDRIENSQHQFPTILGYIRLLQNNREYRLYLCSHLCQHAGDWFVHVASLITIERLLPGNAKAISLMVATKMLPNMLFSPLGGVIADNCDRKQFMITLDILASVIVLGYILALALKSPFLLFTISFLRACITACYEPVTKSIVPMLVANEEDLKRATTLQVIAWSAMLMLGGVVAGISASIFGVEICYIIDSFTYIISAYIMYKVPGTYRVVPNRLIPSITKLNVGTETNHAQRVKIGEKIFQKQLEQWIVSLQYNFWELYDYVTKCGFGMLILFKSSGALVWGTADVLNASLAHIEGNEALTSQRLGMIYSSVGLGCLTGPIVANIFTDMKQLRTLQKACISALAFMTMGWIGLAISVNSNDISDENEINMICFFVFVRTIGSAIIWMNSTLLLQKLMRHDTNMMGRVLSLEFSFAMGSEMLAAFVAGFLHDDLKLPKKEVALAAASIGVILLIFWSLFHYGGGGAAKKEFNDAVSFKQRQRDNDIITSNI